jgi:hypothetical protein
VTKDSGEVAMGFLFFTVMFVPVFMLLIGLLFKKFPTREINWVMGYRSKRSMASKEAWDFAQKHFAALWIKSSALLCVVTLVAWFLFKGENPESTEKYVEVMTYGQVAYMLVTTFLTEVALKKKFGKVPR